MWDDIWWVAHRLLLHHLPLLVVVVVFDFVFDFVFVFVFDFVLDFVFDFVLVAVRCGGRASRYGCRHE